MRRALATVVLLAAFTAAWLAPPVAVPAAEDTPRRVVLVLAPYLSWTDISPTATPTLWRLAEQGAVGDVNARSRNREAGEAASPLEGALTISAGTWAVHAKDAPAAYNANERYEVGTAADAFERTTGVSAGQNRVLFLGVPMTERKNEEASFEAELGSLGESVQRAGGVTAAIGNSDIGYETNEPRRVRPAAMAAMDREGRVRLGDVSRRLLNEDPNAPFGIETDLAAFERTLDEVGDQTEQRDALSLIVLDPGELYRATKFSPQVTPKIAERQRADALRALDAVTRMATERFDDAVVMVVSQSTGDPTIGESEGVGPIIIAGPGWSGFLTSNSTQRTGLVTNPDVSATVLDVLGVARPVEMIGNEMRVEATASPVDARVERLVRLNDTAVAVEDARAGVINVFVALTVVVLALSSFALVRARFWSPRQRRVLLALLKGALLLVLAVPASSWLMFAWMPAPRSVGVVVASLVATALVLWGLLVLVWLRGRRLRLPVAVAALGTAGVILVDQWLGAPASFANIFGYSPLLAARFYGMGNESAAIAFGAALVGIALLFDEWPDAAGVRAGRRYGLPALGLVVVFTAAAPFLGANIGVAVWGLVGFGLAWMLMNDRRFSWKTVVLLFAAVVVMIGAFAAVDLLGGGEQTHLGRALLSARQGGLGELWTIVSRKAETNARVLTRTNWAYILIATLGFLAFMRWRPQGDFAATLKQNSAFADAITVSLVAGFIAFFTEDSGIVISALVVFYVGVALAWLMLEQFSPEDDGRARRE